MYCKEKIYAGVEEYSLEEIRAASIFASIRNGTWSKPKTNDQPTPKVKEMYPKKEVYNFVAELQWEEVRAKHYFAKLAQRHSVPSAPKAHEVQMQPVAIDVGSINQSAALQGSRESGHFKEAQFGSSSGYVECNQNRHQKVIHIGGKLLMRMMRLMVIMVRMMMMVMMMIMMTMAIMMTMVMMMMMMTMLLIVVVVMVALAFEQVRTLFTQVDARWVHQTI